MKLNSKLYHGKRRTTPGPSVVVDTGEGFGMILRHQGTVPAFHWGTNAPDAEREILAQAILADATAGNFSLELATEFAKEVIADLPETGFTIADWQIEAWLHAHTAKR